MRSGKDSTSIRLVMISMKRAAHGTARRAQAAAACLRRLKPLAQAAREGAEASGKLCMQLGVLLGLMAGIALW